MSTDETIDKAVTHLRERLQLLGSRHRDEFPKWSNMDYIAVSMLVRVVLSHQDEERERRARAHP